MSRALRLLVADGWCHATARGNERRAILRGDGDCAQFLEMLGQLPERDGARVAALGAAADGMRYGAVAAAVRNPQARPPWTAASGPRGRGPWMPSILKSIDTTPNPSVSGLQASC